MKPIVVYFLLLSLLCSTTAWSQKRMVITFDDLPQTTPTISLEHAVEANRKILAQLEKYQVPAIGFVNESKVNIVGEVDDRLDILRLWVDQGLDLGNHTYDHKDYSNTPYEEYVEDINKGEVHTKSILQEKNKELKFFRPPFQNTGNTEEEKEKLKLFLEKKGYAIAPSTIENLDFIFNLIYLKAKVENDSSLMNHIIRSYLEFTSLRLDFYEELTMEVVGSLAVPQIFLCHVNALNADCLGQLLDLFLSKGYKFISLDEALQDEAYRKPSSFVGVQGGSWLHRWNDQNREKAMAREPIVHDSILEEYRAIGKKQFWVFLKPRLQGLNSTLLWLASGFISLMTFLLVLVLRVKLLRNNV